MTAGDTPSSRPAPRTPVAGDTPSSRRRRPPTGLNPNRRGEYKHGAGGGGRDGRGGEGGPGGPLLSKNFLMFVCAGLVFFGISTHMAGQQNRMFEKHFSEINKVRAERRKLKEEVALLQAGPYTTMFSALLKPYLKPLTLLSCPNSEPRRCSS